MRRDHEQLLPQELRLRRESDRIRRGYVDEVGNRPQRLRRVHVQVVEVLDVLLLELIELLVRLVEPPEVQQGHAEARGEVQGNIRGLSLALRRELRRRLSLCRVERRIARILIGAFVDRGVVRVYRRGVDEFGVLRLPVPQGERDHVFAGGLDDCHGFVEFAPVHLQLREDVHQRGVRAAWERLHHRIQRLLRGVGVAHAVVQLGEFHRHRRIIRNLLSKDLELFQSAFGLPYVHVQPRLVPPVVQVFRVQTQRLAQAVQRLPRVVQTDGHLRQVIPLVLVPGLEVRGYHEEIQRLLVVLELVVDRAERGVRVRFVGYQTDHLGEQLDGLRVIGLAHREQHVRVAQFFGSLRADHALAGATDAASRLTASEVTPRRVRRLRRGALEEHLVHGVLGYEREPIRVGDVE